ncbi:chemotaxis protein CheY [Bosea sp. AAP35]|uniref:response regulator transcription factor n=1 Tax=Bosea sp. AAP35 TaxID=1523417 RepID=UPI0006B8E79F|nr:response regulator [Bosea sp. AAP35]KPF62757.1 chemotaxis protein CheY [Bosea sp. AAP35]
MRGEPQDDHRRTGALLIVDDDHAYATRLARAMADRGYDVTTATTVTDGRDAIDLEPPEFAIFDLRIGSGNGIELLEHLIERRSDARAIMVSGYANLPTTVSAIKLGAFDYLAKPADADEIDHALQAQGERPPAPEHPMSPGAVRQEHILSVYERSNHNVSETARRLGMHRRTLQRIFTKHGVNSA